MDEPLKRDLRREKREIKKAGVRRVRRALKRALEELPENAATPIFDYGRFSSAPLNGRDRDLKRRSHDQLR